MAADIDDAQLTGLTEVAAELTACLPLLPALSRQLTETSAEIAEAVSAVCRGFEQVAQRAGEAAGAGPEGRDILPRMQTTLGSLLDRLERSAAESETLADRVRLVETGIRRIEEVLARVDEVTSAARLLALNAQIEAARAGEAGAGFAVVAKETKALATETGRMSDDIRTILTAVGRETADAVGELRRRAAGDRERTAVSRDEVGRAISELERERDEMRRAMIRADEGRRAVAAEIGRIVVSMQFQDAASQRISHVVETLGEIGEALRDGLDRLPVPAEPDGGRVRLWAERAERRATMHRERTALGAGSASAGGGPGSVELF